MGLFCAAAGHRCRETGSSLGFSFLGCGAAWRWPWPTVRSQLSGIKSWGFLKLCNGAGSGRKVLGQRFVLWVRSTWGGTGGDE